MTVDNSLMTNLYKRYVGWLELQPATSELTSNYESEALPTAQQEPALVDMLNV